MSSFVCSQAAAPRLASRQTSATNAPRAFASRVPEARSLSARFPQSVQFSQFSTRKTNTHQSRNFLVQAAVSAESCDEWKVIATAEIPALVPREDLLDQLLKWSIMEFEENGRRNYGMKMIVDICDDYVLEDGTPTTFAIKLKDGEGQGAEIEVLMDDELLEAEKGGQDGFASEVKEPPEGQEKNPFAVTFEMRGKNLIIRRKQGDLPESLVPTIREVVGGLSKAINTYYAFGSVYADDAT